MIGLTQAGAMTTPLLGRGDLFARALTALQQRRVVALFGPEGVGKTRLALELAQALAPQSSRRAIIRGSPELQPFSFAAMLHLLRSDLEITNPIQGLRHATEDLRSLSAVVVLVDDVQWLDPNSLAAVQSVAEQGGVRLVLTARTEVKPQLFTRLGRNLDALVESLAPLDDVSIRAICGSVAGGALSRAAEARLLHLAAGNPLHAEELTRIGLQTGSLVVRGETIELVAPLPSDKLRDLVGHHLAGLSGEHRRALELITLGQPLELAAFAQLVSTEAIETLQGRQLISERIEVRNDVAEPILTIAHPLFGEAVNADMPGVRRQIRLLELAEMVGKQDRVRTDHVARQLLWLHAAGHDMSSSDLAAPVDSMSAARLKGLIESGLSHNERQSTERTDASRIMASSIRDRYDEIANLAEIAFRMDPSTENALRFLVALASSDHALEAAATLLDDTYFSASVKSVEQERQFRRIARLVHGYHRQDRERALRIIEHQPYPSGVEPFARLERAALDLSTLEVNAPANDLAELLVDPQLDEFGRVTAALELAVARITQGRPMDTMALIDEHFSKAIANGAEASFMASMWWLRSIALAFDGQFGEAESMLLSTFNASVGADSPEGAGFFADGLAMVARLQGKLRTAVRRSRQAADLLAIRDVGQRIHALGELAFSLCGLGEAAAARSVLDEIQQTANNRPSSRSVAPLVALHVALLEGRNVSLEELDQLWESLESSGAQGHVSLVWIAANCGRGNWASGRTEQMRATVQGRLNLLQLDAVDAVVSDDLHIIEQCFNEANALGAVGVAWTLTVAGRKRAEQTKDLNAKNRWLRWFENTRQMTEGARAWIATSNSEAGTALLSRREAHVARLAASGLADSVIAEQLGLSVRTVESHLTRTYAKLGISGRKDLASVSLP
jgi:DNA-binding CsgD family transcriptional regulator/energy-coupling factor transporter ATP-binding protein EcfA2